MAEDEIKLSKIDVARRQLDCAIKLWFEDGDAVSIHTLLAASYQIIHDLNVRRGNNEATIYARLQKLGKINDADEALKLLRNPMRFFKHADNDPDGVLEFPTNVNDSYIPLASIGLDALGEKRSDMQTIFMIYQLLHKSEIFTEDAEAIILGTLSDDDKGYYRSLSKIKYMELFLAALKRLTV